MRPPTANLSTTLVVRQEGSAAGAGSRQGGRKVERESEEKQENAQKAKAEKNFCLI